MQPQASEMHDESKKERLMALQWLLLQGGEGILKQGVQKEGISWGGKETQRAEGVAQKATGGAAHSLHPRWKLYPKAPWGCHTRLH